MARIQREEECSEPEHFQGRGVPRLQILTIEELLAGTRPDLPRFAPAATFKQAPRKGPKGVRNGEAGLWDSESPE